MKYVVPEYYIHFKCKCGECRQSCCYGWPVSISKLEYYRLLGISCSKKLRIKLDCALKVSPESNEGFAQISADWNGNCSLQQEDGLCSLQTELGENSLPEVCRQYPRHATRQNEGGECSCSNSCEAVVDLLIEQKNPLRFEEINLLFEPNFEFRLSSDQFSINKHSISLLQDRILPLPERLKSLGGFLTGIDLSNLSGSRSIAFEVMHRMINCFEDRTSIQDYCKATQDYFCTTDKSVLSVEDLNTISNKYNLASKHLDVILPDWQLLFEQLIVNHMFYNNFPYADNQNQVQDTYLLLVLVYSFLRYILLGYMSDKTNVEDIVDFLAAVFRVIEHSNFSSVTIHLLRNTKYTVQLCVPELLAM